MKFTVLVITYNSKLQKTLLTLQSILLQEFDGFEIVIADDASKENHFKEIRDFFEERHFTEYKLVGNEKNNGTVKNLISGLQQSAGKYVKFIGAGDALYDPGTLQRVYEYMEKNQYECCFGRLRGYCFDAEGKVKDIRFCYPFDMNAYIRYNPKRILKNLVLYSDNVCGAAICYERHFALEYMSKIQNDVIYEEDIFQVLAAVEGKPLHLFDDYMVWYEIGSGVVTDKNSKYKDLIWNDVQRFYRSLYRSFPENRYVRKRYRIMGLYRIRNLYLRTLLRFFVNPDAFRYFVDTTLQKIKKVHEPKVKREGFLNQEGLLLFTADSSTR